MSGVGVRTAMSTNVENSIKLASAGNHIRQLLGIGPQRLLVIKERLRNGVGLEHLHGALVEWGLSTLRGGDSQGSLLVQDFPGVSELGLEEIDISPSIRFVASGWLC